MEDSGDCLSNDYWQSQCVPNAHKGCTLFAVFYAKFIDIYCFCFIIQDFISNWHWWSNPWTIWTTTPYRILAAYDKTTVKLIITVCIFVCVRGGRVVGLTAYHFTLTIPSPLVVMKILCDCRSRLECSVACVQDYRCHGTIFKVTVGSTKINCWLLGPTNCGLMECT